jgi:4-hydroxybenzoyl-CoA thioesterase
MSDPVFVRQKLIRFHHCDPAGIVFYPQYFILFNELVEDWFEVGIGVDWAELHGERRRGVPMRRIECDFLSPSRIGERLDFRLAVASVGTTSIGLALEAAAAGAVRVRARAVLVYMDLDTHRPAPIEPALRTALSRYAGAVS